MPFSFASWNADYLYLFCLLLAVSKACSTDRNCSFHNKYCFLVQEIISPISTIADLEKLCRTRDGAWPLEIYDHKVQKALDKYLNSLNSSYSLKTVFLNVKRSDVGWQYVQDFDRSKTVDFDDIVHYEDVAYFDVFENKIESGWFNYFKLPYVCSFRTSSSGCNQTGALVTPDLCFTRHDNPKTWVDALKDCRTRHGYLALVGHRHKDELRLWLGSSDNELKQWWIGLAWRPLIWRKKGTIVTWFNFQLDIKMTETPEEIHFKIEADGNRWKVGRNLNSSDLIICMTEQGTICTGRECQMESKRIIPLVELVVVSVVVVVAIVVVAVAVKLWLRRKKRRESSKQVDTAAPFKTIPDPGHSATQQPIYLQPLPDIYQKTYVTIDENQYDKLGI